MTLFGHIERFTFASAAITALSCATAAPAFRPGEPLSIHFAPPTGLSQIYRAVEVRDQTLEFPKGTHMAVRIEITSTQLEKYAPQPDGSFLVSTTQLQHAVARDGVPQPEALSTNGIVLIHRVDATGRFLGIENTKEVLDAIHSRLTTPEERQLIDPQLTPDYLSRPFEASWHQRFDPVCSHPLKPGETTYAFDEQPLDDIGPIRTVVRQTVLGKTTVGARAAEEIALEFGGRDTDFAHSPGALDALLAFPDGLNTLAVNVRGIGRRLVDTSTGQTFSEEVTLTGEGRLNKTAAGQATQITLPLKVRYEIHRQVLRLSPIEAEHMSIPTRYIETPYAIVPPEPVQPTPPLKPDVPPRMLEFPSNPVTP